MNNLQHELLSEGYWVALIKVIWQSVHVRYGAHGAGSAVSITQSKRLNWSDDIFPASQSCPNINVMIFRLQLVVSLGPLL